MPRRHRIPVSPLVALLATACSLAVAQDRGPDPATAKRTQQPAPRATAKARQFPPAEMDDLLRQWEGQSAKLETLEVDIYRTDKDTAWGDETHFAGHAAFKSPDLAYVDYRKVKLQAVTDPNVKGKTSFVPQKKNGQLDAIPFETILCTGAEVWHYRYDTKQVFIWSLDRDARKKALDEGPLPFLFRMRAGDAKQRYEMVLRAQNAKSSLVMILPKMKEDREVFRTAWVTLDRAFLLPTRIVLISPDQTKQQDFVLSNIRANKPVKDQYFVGVKPGKPWKIEINPGAKEAGPAIPKRQRRAGDSQGAQRPAAAGGAVLR